jgi:hypothetical protein
VNEKKLGSKGDAPCRKLRAESPPETLSSRHLYRGNLRFKISIVGNVPIEALKFKLGAIGGFPIRYES